MKINVRKGVFTDDVITVFSFGFKRSKGEIRRLMNQKGLYAYRGEEKIMVTNNNFNFQQNDILRIGRNWIRAHFNIGWEAWEEVDD